jgi:hypothetical protein
LASWLRGRIEEKKKIKAQLGEGEREDEVDAE